MLLEIYCKHFTDKNRDLLSTRTGRLFIVHDRFAKANWNRTLSEKYSELKLQAQFLKVSPAYLTTKPQNPIASAGGWLDGSNTAIVTTLAKDQKSHTSFFIVRLVDIHRCRVDADNLSDKVMLARQRAPLTSLKYLLVLEHSQFHSSAVL